MNSESQAVKGFPFKPFRSLCVGPPLAQRFVDFLAIAGHSLNPWPEARRPKRTFVANPTFGLSNQCLASHRCGVMKRQLCPTDVFRRLAFGC